MARATAAVREFLNIWECGGTASLKLDTNKGGCTVSFTAHLGHPGALLQASPPPTSPACASPRFQHAPSSPSSSGQRYRGPADKQRSRVRAADFQAAAEAAAPVLPAPVLPAPVLPSPVLPTPVLPSPVLPSPVLPTPEPPAPAKAAADATALKAVPSPPSSPVPPTLGVKTSKTLTDETADIEIAESETAKSDTAESEPLTAVKASFCIGMDSGDVASTSCKALLPPPTEVKCWNCDRLMASNHQCEEPSSASPGTLAGPSKAYKRPPKFKRRE